MIGTVEYILLHIRKHLSNSVRLISSTLEYVMFHVDVLSDGTCR
jgi:hypothetical protein